MPPFHLTAVRISPLLFGVALLLLGTGLLNTLLAVRASAEGFGQALLGVIMSSYFCGFIVGTFTAPLMIRRAGHIRTFAICAALASSTAIGHALSGEPLVWMLLRALTGISLVGLYAVVESWLATQAHGGERGRVFALYMVVNLLALAAGQFLMLLADPNSLALFGIVSMLVSLSIIPVALTRLEQPQPPHSPRLRVRRMVWTAPVAAAGALCSGLAMGAFWGMAPAFVQQQGALTAEIAVFMSATILGGAALQWPLGRYSDGGDRRYALGLVSLAAASVILLVWAVNLLLNVLALPLMFLYGGLAFAAYPVAMAHLSDRLPPQELLEGASVLLLVHGLGAAVGPALGGLLMGLLGPGWLLAYLAACWALLAACCRWALTRQPARWDETPQPFVPMLRTSAAALELLSEETESAQGLVADSSDAVR